MFTKKEFRRKGIATILFEKIFNEAKILNYRIFRLHTSIYGKGLYKKYGFTDSEGFMYLKI